MQAITIAHSRLDERGSAEGEQAVAQHGDDPEQCGQGEYASLTGCRSENDQENAFANPKPRWRARRKEAGQPGQRHGTHGGRKVSAGIVARDKRKQDVSNQSARGEKDKVSEPGTHKRLSGRFQLPQYSADTVTLPRTT